MASNVSSRYCAPAAQPIAPPPRSMPVVPLSTASNTIVVVCWSVDTIGNIQLISSRLSFDNAALNCELVAPVIGLRGMALLNGLYQKQLPAPGVPVAISQPGPPNPRSASW